MTVYYVLVFTILGLISLSVVLAWYWAVKTDQFSNFKKGATSIFDEDEPVGHLTDMTLGTKEELERLEAAKE